MKAVEGVQRVARPTPSGVGAPRLCAFRQRRDLDDGVVQWFPRHLSRRRRTTDDEA